MTAAQLRARIRARQGWQTRRRARIAELERRRRRLRRQDRLREVDREIAEIRRQLRQGEREIRDLRRQLAALRRQEAEQEEQEAPPPAPEPPLEPPPPPVLPPRSTYEGRWIAAGGGVSPTLDGRRRGTCPVPPPEGDTPDEWAIAVGDLVDQLAPHPDEPDPTWRGRLWVAVEREAEEDLPETDDPSYETDEGPSPMAGSIHRRSTYSGWTPRPERLALIADLVTEALMRQGWLIEEIWIEAVWGGPGYLPRKDLR